MSSEPIGTASASRDARRGPDDTTGERFSRSASSAARRYAPHFIGVAALEVVGAVAGLLPLLAVAELGRILLSPSPAEGGVWTVVAIGIAGVVLNVVFGAASGMLGHLLDGRVQLALRRQLVQHLGKVPLGWLSSRRAGELSRIVGDDVGALHPFVAHMPAQIASAIVVPLVSLAYLLTIDWRLTLVSLIPVAVALALVPFLMMPARTREQTQYEGSLARLSNVVVDLVQGIPVAKTFGEGGNAQRALLSAADEFVGVFSTWVRGMSPAAAGMQVALSAPFVLLVVSVGALWLIGTGGVEPPDVLPFLLLGLGLTAPVATLGHGFDDLTAAGRALGRIEIVLRTPVLDDPTDPRMPVGGRVDFRDVRFTYPDGEEVLRGVNLTLEPDTLTVLVGSSGAGKSTLVRLLPRFFDVTSGSVSVGGVDIRDIAADALYQHVSFVFQEVQLLRASVFDNIALGKPGASREEAVRAARLAGIHQRILQLPRGYDTDLEAEATLSGGEAQRITIARALLTDAPVLVLDEPTSFADPETERLLRRNLRELRRGRTILLISHRSEAVADADIVAVLEDGVIVELGPPHALPSTDGRYTAPRRAHTIASPSAGSGEGERR
ncbi:MULTISPECIES: ABC transporter ATP-binding protein [Microbacterium]|uniref:ABC transporter ATP-binding protein n=1 Tax=Microbacterium TaxID=33882 RepID=UPI001951162D|nr:ABC transporter ATP-binding protein [Microbacterium sp. KCTC 39802]